MVKKIVDNLEDTDNYPVILTGWAHTNPLINNINKQVKLDHDLLIFPTKKFISYFNDNSYLNIIAGLMGMSSYNKKCNERKEYSAVIKNNNVFFKIVNERN